MEYLKVPYVRLSGKKYGGDLSRQEQVTINEFFNNYTGEDMYYANDAYYGVAETFQELYKIYKNGGDPANEINTSFSNEIPNPEKLTNIHNAISSVANQYGYKSPDKSKLIAMDMDVFQKISIPNSYFISRTTPGQPMGNMLVIVDNNLILSYLILPLDRELEIKVDADENRNVLIPKKAYDENLEIF
jgi:hypothetical protein